ncbi:MGH1-like glycoside hydrolase domain-containing protein [Catelliglobosispora koreensis]|uniref:MGH1-like glycoside hydrolase domain-containing protein n=1 Tax=Catelliglobosispora koreensis TaxID=129052 RepID=UPI000364DB75|nr:hypothetical protein [Catelliglobosispora koreensis]
MAEFRSGDLAYDAAYAKAAADVAGNVVNGRFVAGKRWNTIWTRDSSYAFDLGVAFSHPAEARATLEALAPQGFWRQDPCRHFGGWPNLTDSIVGTVGAWAVYLANGDEEFLRWSFNVSRLTLERAEHEAWDAETGLFRGCSSFMESNSGYPFRFHHNGTKVGRTKALSTNVLYYRGYLLAARMGALLGADVSSFYAKANELRDKINEHLWVPDKQLYAYFEYEHGTKSSRMEGLGESLAVLWGVADDDQAEGILSQAHVTKHGIPCLWPPYALWRLTWNDAHYYHNGMVWPFVQGYWALAAASQGRSDLLSAELTKLADLAGRDGSFHEFYRPVSGRPDGSARQLWSAAGYQAMVHFGLFGIQASEEGLKIRPLVPEGFRELTLTGFRYRDMTLDIHVTGTGQAADTILLPTDLTGHQSVDVTLGT